MLYPKPTKKIKEKKRVPRKGKSSLAKAKERAWKAFSLWVRMSNADINGNVKCITCPKIIPWREAQAGHFISGRTNAVLFSEEGVHPQCVGCNMFGRGKWTEYFEKMVELYGIEFVQGLIKDSHESVRYTEHDYEELARYYTDKVTNL
jgi:hypothetical protein